MTKLLTTMEIWYRPKLVLKSYKCGQTAHIYDMNYRYGRYQLDTNAIYLPNEHGMYEICKMLKDHIHIMNIKNSLSFKNLIITFYINNSYVGFYPENFSNEVFEDAINKKSALTYEEAIIKQLLE